MGNIVESKESLRHRVFAIPYPTLFGVNFVDFVLLRLNHLHPDQQGPCLASLKVGSGHRTWYHRVCTVL